MKILKFFLATLIIFAACKKNVAEERPNSKTDYLPIFSAITPKQVAQGQPIISRVTCGTYDYFADITFLNFEVKELQPRHYDIRARAFYDNINYEIALAVLVSRDTTLVIPTPTTGNYILKFYAGDKIIQRDTVLVN